MPKDLLGHMHSGAMLIGQRIICALVFFKITYCDFFSFFLYNNLYCLDLILKQAMKYLDVKSFKAVNSLMSFPTSSGDRHVVGRLEAYSCKAAGTDKKLYRYLENKYQDGLREAKHLSPEQSFLTNTVSPFGPLTQSASRRTLFYLIATLNASFPDYDFR